MTKEFLDLANKVNGKIGRVESLKNDFNHRVEMLKVEHMHNDEIYTDEDIATIEGKVKDITDLLDTKIAAYQEEFTNLKED